MTNDDTPDGENQFDAITIQCRYAPDGEPERTNKELIDYIAKHLVQKLESAIRFLGVGKCVLHNKTFTLELRLFPFSVITEDFFKDSPDERA